MTFLPEATHVPAHLDVVGPVIDLTAVISGTTNLVTDLSEPFKLSAEVLANSLNSNGEQRLGWYYWDGSTWVHESTTTFDPQDKVITAEADNFSLWAVFNIPTRAYLPVVLTAN